MAATVKVGFQTKDPVSAKAGTKGPVPARAALQNVVQSAPSAKAPAKSEIQFGKNNGGYGGSSTTSGTIKVPSIGTNLQK